MQETEINLSDVLFAALRKWRKIIVFAIICAVAAGVVAGAVRAVQMNDPAKVELWKTEYEVAYGSYWAGIHDLDRQISENERLASQAELAIEKLDLKKADYEGNLEDLAAKITYYEALVEDYKAKIENLQLEKEKLNYYLAYRQEQNENSLLMDIDPYNVNVYESYLRVDSGYEILPGSTYQNVDPTAELLQTYRLLVNSTSFYDKMISDLKLNTEVRYLTEVISVAAYGTNSLRIRVISDSVNWAKMVGEYVAEAVLAEHDRVALSVAEHELAEYNTNSYAVVDLDIYSRQYAFIQEAINYEAEIRGVDTSILNTEADIREMNTDIRAFRQQIEDTYLAINELPLQAQAYENEIVAYEEANYDLRAEQLVLLDEDEPEYEGYTPLSILTGFVKFAVIGGVVGAVVAALYFAVAGILSGKVLSSGQLCLAVGSEFFGFWPKTSKKRFAFVDRWIGLASGVTNPEMTPEIEKDLVLSNAAVACGGKTKVMLCGGGARETVAAVADAVKEQVPGVELISGGTIGFDPNVVRGLSECDAVILVEQMDKSSLTAAVQLKDRAKAMGKPVVGVVLS